MKLLSVTFFSLIVATHSQFLQANNDIKNACEKTIQDYAVYRDALDAENFANTFSEDGVFATPNGDHKGYDGIVKYIHNQSDEFISYHMVTTMQINPVDESTANGIVYGTVHIGERTESGPAKLVRSIDAIYNDKYVIKDGACKIQHRSLKQLIDHSFAE